MTKPTLPILTVGMAVVLLAGAAQAGPDLMRPGPGLTYGRISAPDTVTSVVGNPAAGSATAGDGVRFGIVSSVGLSYEAGSADNFVDNLDLLLDELDRDNLSRNEAEQIIDRFDGLLERVGKDGYLKVNGSAQAPLTPFVVSTEAMAGTLSLDVRFGAQARLTFLDAPLVFDDVRQALDTDSAVYVKGGRWREIGVGYGLPVLSIPTGRLHAGVRLVHYQARLSKSVIALQDIDDGDDIPDVLGDEFDSNTRESTALGVDLGLLWVTPTYQAGATLANLNTPTFDYPRIGRNCGRLTGARRANCLSAARFSDRVELSERYDMTPQLTLEAAWFPFSTRRWMLAGAWDVNDANDPVGDPRQWLSVSGGYLTDSWVIPGVRAGYHRNLVGSELSYVSLGTTLLTVLNVDLAWTPERVTIGGDRQPRAAAVTAGIELAF